MLKKFTKFQKKFKNSLASILVHFGLVSTPHHKILVTGLKRLAKGGLTGTPEPPLSTPLGR